MLSGTGTPAKDWFATPDKFRLNSTSGNGTFSFKVGSVSIRMAALMVMVGKVSGNPVPDALDYKLAILSLKVRGNAYSLNAWHGLKGEVTHGSQFSDENVVSPNAFRRTGAVVYNVDFPEDDLSQFSVKGQWVLKQTLVFSETFFF